MKDTIEFIQSAFLDSANLKTRIAGETDLLVRIADAAEIIIEKIQAGHTVFFCGNGGSAADAQHIAAEFTGRFLLEREPLSADVLGINFSHLTAVGNDYGFEDILVRDLKAKAKTNDILFAISTSGNSANIIKAAQYAREKNIFCIGMTGESGGLLAQYTDILINVPSVFTPRIQEAHITIGHIICDIIDRRITNQ